MDEAQLNAFFDGLHLLIVLMILVAVAPALVALPMLVEPLIQRVVKWRVRKK